MSQWPIVVMRIEGKLVGEEIDQWVTTSTTLPDRNERYVAIIDLLDAKMPSVESLRKQAKAQGEAEDRIRMFCAGIAFVIGAPMIRGALRAILHMQDLPSPYRVVTSVREAEAWGREQLAKSE